MTYYGLKIGSIWRFRCSDAFEQLKNSFGLSEMWYSSIQTWQHWQGLISLPSYSCNYVRFLHVFVHTYSYIVLLPSVSCWARAHWKRKKSCVKFIAARTDIGSKFLPVLSLAKPVPRLLHLKMPLERCLSHPQSHSCTTCAVIAMREKKKTMKTNDMTMQFVQYCTSWTLNNWNFSIKLRLN